MNLDLSVIIVNHHTKVFLENCLDSLIRTMPAVKYEILLINNTPLDGSSEMVAEKFPMIRVIENPECLGYARNNNIGLKNTGGKYVWLLNPDTEIKPDACRIMLDFLEEHQDVAMVGPRYLNPDNTIQPLSCNRFPGLFNDFLQFFFISQMFPRNRLLSGLLYPQIWDNMPFQVDALVGASIIFRREIIEKAGSLDESFYMFFEETDWCFRLRKAGWKIWLVPQAEIIHFGSGSANGNLGRSRIIYYQSYLHYYRKHHGKIKTLIAKILLFCGLLMRVIYWFIYDKLPFTDSRKRNEKYIQWKTPFKWLILGENK